MSSIPKYRTVFLTTEEDARIRKNFKGRLQKSGELEGQSRASRDRKILEHRVATTALLADLALDSRPKTDSISALAVGDPYPPSFILLQELQQIGLADLRMNEHHRGKVLIVRRVASVVKLIAYSWTIIQDDSSGETERLEICMHKTRYGKDLLELGSTFQIKEPYFTLNDEQEPTLRIDHPSDLVICAYSDRQDSENVGGEKNTVSLPNPGSLAPNRAMEFKEEGNAALKQRNTYLAHVNYTEGLRLANSEGSEKSDLVCNLFRNRAHANLLLNRFDEAKMDALASLTGIEDQMHKELDSKAYLRAGNAAYSLGDFQEANRLFEELERLKPGDKDAEGRVRKPQLRLKEQATGIYNFKKIKAGLQINPRVDAANFTSNVKIAESPGRGRGLFATHEIPQGDIIMCEKAFSVIWDHEEEDLTAMTYDTRDDRIRVSPAGLCKSIVQKLLNNPSQIEKVIDLYGDYPGFGKQPKNRDVDPIIDVFQVHDIVTRNAFGPGSIASDKEKVGGTSAGLWILASYMNHSCIPNATKEYIGDMMVVRAIRSIRTGEEITHSYNASHDYEVRTAELLNTWGFTCTCALCIAEEEDGSALREKRKRLENEANALIHTETSVIKKRISIVKARRLIQSIKDTYDEKRYRDLPQTALFGIQEWLRKATTR